MSVDFRSIIPGHWPATQPPVVPEPTVRIDFMSCLERGIPRPLTDESLTLLVIGESPSLSLWVQNLLRHRDRDLLWLALAVCSELRSSEAGRKACCSCRLERGQRCVSAGDSGPRLSSGSEAAKPATEVLRLGLCIWRIRLWRWQFLVWQLCR